ncbi:MAG: 2-oxoacid:acceptor oxidoreductase family protein, partial [Gammaproteobacteria bacterium]|nr:2-oxoacid:acceptor oxidoreductase family protein [Gammaproteobacteria bacterium]
MSTIGTERNLRIMTGTVGGQGGGVIATWLVRGLLNSGWQAQSTSLLGMSQRAGSVTAYIEARQGATSLPLVSSYPVPGDLDLVIGQELLEMARILQQGLPGRECAIISNTHRYLATIEKMPAEGGIYSSEAILNAVQQMAPNRHWLFNAQHIVAEAGLSPLSTNAVLLGAAMGALGLDAAPFRQSIEEAKIGVKDNLLAFDLGYSQVQDGTLPTAQFIDPRPQSPWQAMQEERTAKLQRYGGDVTAYGRLMERFTTELRGLDPAIGAEALYRLIDYQDGAYAELYLQRVKVRADAEAG